jgi:hypothetical protein
MIVLVFKVANGNSARIGVCCDVVYSRFNKVITLKKGSNTDHDRSRYIKLISRPKPTSSDAAESSGFAPLAYRPRSLQYCRYSPRCSGVAQVRRLMRISFAQRTTRVLLRIHQDGVQQIADIGGAR